MTGADDRDSPDVTARIAARPEEGRVVGEELVRSIALDLAHAGASVVSGGAPGIDGAARRAALEAGGHTVAVLGTRVDVACPASNRGPFAVILPSRGRRASEQRDGTPGLPAQDRIASANCEAAVVVQAGKRSGALIAARWARHQRRPVLVALGGARDELSAGPHALIRRRATLVDPLVLELERLGAQRRGRCFGRGEGI
jgi:DNA processing protein